jgi:hypothetical protein
VDDRVILTRRADGARFRIYTQARSPDGTCVLLSVDSPVEVVNTTNDRVLFDFIDPRKGIPTCETCRADKVQHPALGQRFVCLACDRRGEETLERRDEHATARDPLDVSDIPMADEVVHKIDTAAEERLKADVGRLLDAVRMQLRKPDPRGDFDAIGRGLDFVDGTIKRVNELLAPLRWHVQLANGQSGRAGWYTLRTVSP